MKEPITIKPSPKMTEMIYRKDRGCVSCGGTKIRVEDRKESDLVISEEKSDFGMDDVRLGQFSLCHNHHASQA